MLTNTELSRLRALSGQNEAAVAARLPTLGYGENEIMPSLEERLEIVRFMRTPLVFPRGLRWSRINRDDPAWNSVGDAEDGWRDFDDHIKGDAFAGCLRRAMHAAVGEDWCPANVEYNASAEDIVATLRAHIEEEYEDTYEDGRTMGEDTKAVLDMNPLLLVAVHLRMEAVFIEVVKDCPDLMLNGSFESVQDDLNERWSKVMAVLVEAQLAKTSQACA